VTWKAVEKEGMVKVWLTTTNHFQKGGRDLYYLMDEVPAGTEKTDLDVSKIPSKLYKIVLEARHNNLNRWVTE
jgi:hypothetical protein